MQEEIAVVGIKYRKSSKTYYFNPRHLELKMGTEVLVDTVNGLAVDLALGAVDVDIAIALL